MSTYANDTSQPPKSDAPGLKRPFMLAYTVKPIDDGRKSVWSKIGAAWSHKDGQGYEVRMDAHPVDGRIVLRTIRETDEDHTGELFEQTPE
ncbi:MAG: hypothetical protein AAF922_07890 [Pseudomonadota bacterium]